MSKRHSDSLTVIKLIAFDDGIRVNSFLARCQSKVAVNFHNSWPQFKFFGKKILFLYFRFSWLCRKDFETTPFKTSILIDLLEFHWGISLFYPTYFPSNNTPYRWADNLNSYKLWKGYCFGPDPVLLARIAIYYHG